jgi:hypothetical protein
MPVRDLPRNVRRFELLMYAGILIDAASLPFPALSGFPSLTLSIVAFGAGWWGFVVWLVWQTARRAKNWSRWLLFALFLLQTAQLVYLAAMLRLLPPALALMIGVSAIEAAAYYFIFTGDSRQWFRREALPVDSVFQ